MRGVGMTLTPAARSRRVRQPASVRALIAAGGLASGVIASLASASSAAIAVASVAAGAQHHLLALEALGVVTSARNVHGGTAKYRCTLLPGDTAAVATSFGIDLWQLTTAAIVRNA